MKFIKITNAFIIGGILQGFSLPLEATEPPMPIPFTYAHPSQYCFAQGWWSGDLSKMELRYHLIIPPADQGKLGSIFVGFRRKSAPDKLWLFGIPNGTNQYKWVQYDPNQRSLAYEGGPLQAVTKIYLPNQPTDITQFEGDGEILVGYGLAEVTFNAHTFEDMLNNNRFSSIWQVNRQQPIGFGASICIQYTGITTQNY
ncbi:MAG: hypothetical protein HOP02_08970 [Methylococcaceae bacterium]|nr:hypothetical protein [Methylococcaceae bacterium]